MEITAHGTVRVRGNTQNTREENPCWLSISNSVNHSSEVDIDGHLCSPVRGLSSNAHTKAYSQYMHVNRKSRQSQMTQLRQVLYS